MDDPWGSPWADELQSSIPPPAAAKTKGPNGLTLAPIPPGKNEADTEKTNSPWELPGDAFGSWASPPLVQEIKEGKSSNVSLDWEARGAGDIKRTDVGGLSPNWDESQAGSSHSTPKLSPTPLPKPNDLPREPSPDPWAGIQISPDTAPTDKPDVLRYDKDATLDTTDLKSPSERSRLQPEARSSPESKECDLSTANDNTTATETAPEKGDRHTRSPIDTSESQKEGNDTDELSRSSSSPSDHSHPNGLHAESPRTSLEDDAQRPEVHRHVSEKIQVLVEHYDALAKSQIEDVAIYPRTPRSERGEVDVEGQDEEQRQSPSAIMSEVIDKENPMLKEDKEDVEGQFEDDLHHDDINEDIDGAKAEDEVKDEDNGEDKDDDDFGDFEEGNSQISVPIEAAEETLNSQRHELPADSQASEALNKATTVAAKDAQAHTQEKIFGRIEFAIDTSALDKLYTGLKPESPSANPEDKLVIPDAVPRDSFTSVEERKMWYRLSRYTTLRQHNSGDDDNHYIRISWPESKIREETLKLAGKWMEQDRISGRVVLGGGSKDGSLFGWNDPKSAPMPLAAAFAINKGKKKAQPSVPVSAPAAEPPATSPIASREPLKGSASPHLPPENRSPPKQRRRSSTKATRTSEDSKQRSPKPVATFGWSSEPQQTPVLSVVTSNPTTKSSDMPSAQKPAAMTPQAQRASDIFVSTSSPHVPSSFSDWDAPPRPVKSSSPVVPLATATQSSSDDFNDEWGEMMSSPAVEAAPQLPIQMPPQVPLVRKLGHKKSQSLIGVSLPSSEIPSNQSTLPTGPFGSGHRPTSSLDGILNTEMPHASQLSNLLSTSSNPSGAFSTAAKLVAPVADSSYDPWASADFSVFDTPAPQHKPQPTQPPRYSTTNARRPSVKSVSFESTRAVPPQRRSGSGKTREEMEQDKVVRRIIKGLPDLSYMLRR